jgi:ADP-heptose:LPS heptosyltransferase
MAMADGAAAELYAATDLDGDAGGEDCRWRKVRRVLCIRLDNLGDVLMCTPAIRALRQFHPGRHITLLASPAGAALAPLLPDIDEAIAFDAPWVKQAAAASLHAVKSAGQQAGGRVAPSAFQAMGADWPQVAPALPLVARPRPRPNENKPNGGAGNTSGFDAEPHIERVDAVEALLALLRRKAFDAAVIFTSYSQSPLPVAMLCYQAGIPLRLAHCRENPYLLLTDWLPECEPQPVVRHEVSRQLALVAAVGNRPDSEHLGMCCRPRDLDWMAERLAQEGLCAGVPWVLVHPGATAASRRYPQAQWVAVIRDLVHRHGLRACLTGDAGESALVAGIARAVDGGERVVSLAGQLELGQLAAAIALAPLLLSNNTGPAHMAAALGTPLVTLYALTNPQHAPWQVPHRLLFHDVPCRFCYKSVCPQGHHACLAGVDPQAVVANVLELLAAVQAGLPARTGQAGVPHT